jgi:hypothetical protein
MLYDPHTQIILLDAMLSHCFVIPVVMTSAKVLDKLISTKFRKDWFRSYDQTNFKVIRANTFFFA